MKEKNVFYGFTISLLLTVILLYSGINSTVFSSAQLSDSQYQTKDLNGMKFDPGFEKKISDKINSGDKREYTVTIIVKKIYEKGFTSKQTVESNKDKLVYALSNIHHATVLYRGQMLSFVTAKVPLQEIPKLANYDFVVAIGDGEIKLQPLSLSMDDAKFNIDVPSNFQYNGSGVKVAVIDSGIEQNLTQDLPINTKKIIAQVDCTSGSCLTTGNFNDDIDHGTHNAGIIAGLGINSSSMKGVAPGALLLNARVGSDTGSIANLGPALDWALLNNAKVANISMGTGPDVCNGPFYTSVNLIVDEAVDEGLVVVAAAGNVAGSNLNSSILSPACGYNAIAVGAIDDMDTKTKSDDTVWTNHPVGGGSSARGPVGNLNLLKPELVAPGVRINSTDFCTQGNTYKTPYNLLNYFRNDGSGLLYCHTTINSSPYGNFTGTSHSAPFISGATALLLQAHPEYTPLEVKTALLIGANYTWNPNSSLRNPIPMNATYYEAHATKLFNNTLNADGLGELDVNNTLTLAKMGNNIIQDSISQGEAKMYTFSANNNTMVKVILSWLKHPTGNVTNPTDLQVSNLNFNITRSDGILVAASNSKNQTNEFAVFKTNRTDTYTISVNATTVVSLGGSTETFALASDHALTRGSFLVKSGTFTKTTSTAPASQSIWLPFKPKAVILYSSGLNSSGFSSKFKFSIGFSNGSSSRATGMSSGNNISPSLTGRAFGTNVVEIIKDTGLGTAVAEANMTSFKINNFTINWTKNDKNPTLINYLALGGSELKKVSVSSFSANTTGGNQTVKIGFKPDLVMFMRSGKTTETGTNAGAYINYGFAMPFKRNGIAVVSVNNTSTNTCAMQRTDRATVAINYGTCVSVYQMDNVYFNLSNGFTVHWLTAPASAEKVYYLALQGGAYDIGNFTQPTSTTPVKQTIKEAIQPNGLLISSFNGPASSIVVPNDRISLGSSDNTTSGTIWAGDRNHTATTKTARLENTTQVITLATEPTTGTNYITNATASIVTMNSTGFTLNWIKDDSIARQLLYTAFGRNPIDNDIIVTEETIPTSKTNFTLTSTTLQPSSFVLANYANSNDTKIFANLLPGIYNVTENSNSNYTTTAGCNDGSQTKAITLKSGQTITCTFTNTLLTLANIVTASYNSTEISAIQLNKTGGFGSPTYYGTGPTPSYDLAIADFNKDGNKDVVALGPTGKVSVFLGNGTGKFGLPTSISVGVGAHSLYGVAAADLNGDGFPDIITSDSQNHTVSVLINNSTGGFGTPTLLVVPDIYANIHAVTTADLRGIGTQDIIVTDVQNSSMWVFLNDGTGTFGTPRQYWINGNQPDQILAADFNGTGKPDILIANDYGATLSLLYNNGTYTNGTVKFSPPDVISLSGRAGCSATIVVAAVGDFNNDGHADIATANQVYSVGSPYPSVAVFLNDGHGGFGSPTCANDTSSNIYRSGIAAADLNNDGNMDVVTTSPYSNQITVLFGNGTGKFTSESVLTETGHEPAHVKVADFRHGR